MNDQTNSNHLNEIRLFSLITAAFTAIGIIAFAVTYFCFGSFKAGLVLTGLIILFALFLLAFKNYLLKVLLKKIDANKEVAQRERNLISVGGTNFILNLCKNYGPGGIGFAWLLSLATFSGSTYLSYDSILKGETAGYMDVLFLIGLNCLWTMINRKVLLKLG